MKTKIAMVVLAAAWLGMLIGYWVAPSAHYTVGGFRVSDRFGFLYRCDTHTGKTWIWASSESPWREIAEPNQEDSHARP